MKPLSVPVFGCNVCICSCFLNAPYVVKMMKGFFFLHLVVFCLFAHAFLSCTVLSRLGHHTFHLFNYNYKTITINNYKILEGVSALSPTLLISNLKRCHFALCPRTCSIHYSSDVQRCTNDVIRSVLRSTQPGTKPESENQAALWM